MEFIRGIKNLQVAHNGCVLTIGKFDGVHLGHQQVLAQLLCKAQSLNLPAAAMIFEPQPEEFFAPDKCPARLSHWTDKYRQLKKLGLDRLICARFDRYFSSQSPEFFIQTLLVEKLGVKYLVVGDDFRFGKNRAGDFSMLVDAGAQFGFEVVNTNSFKLGNDRISSSMIRQYLETGNLVSVAKMLGRPFAISGRVIHGQKKGRTIGYPTANIPIKVKRSPVQGVFLSRVVLAQGVFWGMTNVGTRPTLNGKGTRLEVHIFDFDGDLYNQRIEVEFLHKLRNEMKFASFEMLQQQIKSDEQQALKLVDSYKN